MGKLTDVDDVTDLVVHHAAKTYLRIRIYFVNKRVLYKISNTIVLICVLYNAVLRIIISPVSFKGCFWVVLDALITVSARMTLPVDVCRVRMRETKLNCLLGANSDKYSARRGRNK